MLSKLLEYLKNKNILILGFGIEGKSTYLFIRKHFPEKKIIICDSKENYEEDLVNDKFVQCIHNNEYLRYVDNVDLIFKTPRNIF